VCTLDRRVYRWDIITLMELLTTRAVVQRSIIWCWMAFITLITPQDSLLSMPRGASDFLPAPLPPPPSPLRDKNDPIWGKTNYGAHLRTVLRGNVLPPSPSLWTICGRPCSLFLHVSFLKGGPLEHCVVIFVFRNWFAGMLRP
jgi:hypothetical protein